MDTIPIRTVKVADRTVDERHVQRIIERLGERPESGCWEWPGSRTWAGYGVVNAWNGGNNPVYVHRVIGALLYGDLTHDQFVLHKCDNPPCCNPSHIWVGTNRENVADMDAKGRRVINPLIGSQHWNARLTEQEVASLRFRFLMGEPRWQLAVTAGITAGHLNRILSRACWRATP